ncbi:MULTISPECIES: hypothetical protein [Sphingomonas]|uniref:hypothetical protein n=1 Tax=Sphingomonas TaxID=13687 RepID=UPI0013B4702D|nr:MULTISPECIES: hypothetical protein [Sphingomonas]
MSFSPDRTKEFLDACSSTELRYIALAAQHDRLIERVETLEDTVRLLSTIINSMFE